MDRKIHTSYLRIFILSILFLSTGVVSFALMGETKLISKNYKLINFPNELQGWKGMNADISQNVLKELDIDDFLFRNYEKDNRAVNLYIGYYYTLSKTGKIHSPLVCFPGQGWEISNDQSKKIFLNNGKYSLNARTIVAQKNNSKELVMFWYQAHDKALARTFLQKMTVFYNKIFMGKEDNAFVRITATMNNKGDAVSTLQEFVEGFYPEFMKYVKS